MAAVTPTREFPLRMGGIRYPEIDLRGLSMSSSSSEIVEESPSVASCPPTPSPFAPLSLALNIDEAVYVAVGKETKEAELTLSWALHNCAGRKTVILHVHQPAQKIQILGANVNIKQLEDNRVRAYHEAEREDMQKLLVKYMLICKKAGVQVEKVYMEMESIEKGIVELISQHGIKKLVMGGAAKGHYSKKLLEPKSKKAIYVRQHAPAFCQIRFVCKGHLIHTRESKHTEAYMDIILPSLQALPSTEIGQSHALRSRSVPEGLNGQLMPLESPPDHRRVLSSNHGRMFSALSPYDGTRVVAPYSRFSVERNPEALKGIELKSPSVGSHFSSCSSSEMLDDATLISNTGIEGSGNELQRGAQLHSDEHHSSIVVRPQLAEGNMKNELYDMLQQYVEEAETARREAFEESLRRRKAEKEARLLRKEVEEAVIKHKQEIEMMNCQLQEIKEKLQIAMEQKSSLECKIATSKQSVQDLEQKMFSAVELMQKYKNERDELQVERDNAFREAEKLRQNQAEEASGASMSCFVSEYSFGEIELATRNFDPALKIGEGGYGSIYRGLLHHTQVAVKILNPRSLQGPVEYQQEVNILSKLRHPNLITLIGACPEAWALIYEYLPNGSLEDRLNCKDNTPPLSWQTRIRIASELCSVLIFLHCCSPRGIIHGDLKPSNILLDANFVSKLSDFGICRVLHKDEFSENNTTLCCRTGPKGTLGYMDPKFLTTGELTRKSDVYSFGIILLKLLTGKPALGIAKEVQAALNKENLIEILDPTAGDWPFVQAQQLAHLALSCCVINRRDRPDLSSAVWRVLQPMRASCGASTSRLIPEEQSQIPSYFICPIFQEVMQDAVVAADGFTYEAEAIRGWLDGGHDTSPMTNLKLTHCNLVPNHTLRSAIQEGSQQP